MTQEEFVGPGLRLWMANTLPRLLLAGGGGRLRSAIYRALGIQVGPNTIIVGATVFSGRGFEKRLQIGARCFINSHVYMDVSAPINIGDGVSIGHHVVIITADHAIGPPEFRAGTLQPASVTIEDGAWIAAGVTLLPGVTVGHGAIVAAGAVVTRDVAPNTLVGGVPAKFLKDLPH